MKKELTKEDAQTLMETLQKRFTDNPDRHKGISWDDVRAKLNKHPDKMWSLKAMEDSGGEPDVVAYDEKSKHFIFVDCAAESPKGRRSLCYDRDALESRKKHKPEGDAETTAVEMGIELLSVKAYRQLQDLGNFDSKTSSWLRTPDDIREKGGAIFGDFRFGRVFIYHNGAESYYGARGFRGSLKV